MGEAALGVEVGSAGVAVAQGETVPPPPFSGAAEAVGSIMVGEGKEVGVHPPGAENVGLVVGVSPNPPGGDAVGKAGDAVPLSPPEVMDPSIEGVDRDVCEPP